uniref:Uncharacterized protein n=1 Tax=Hyaloperonospora arabidopsidis (strain Emoy2) TaxID=559515 RepID=M4C6P8_HYAAE
MRLLSHRDGTSIAWNGDSIPGDGRLYDAKYFTSQNNGMRLEQFNNSGSVFVVVRISLGRRLFPRDCAPSGSAVPIGWRSRWSTLSTRFVPKPCRSPSPCPETGGRSPLRRPEVGLVLFEIALLLCTRVIARAGQPSGSDEPQYTPTSPLRRSPI